jgi:hypothetical protein
MSYLKDIADAEQWLSDWQASIVDRAERAGELAQRVAALHATAEGLSGRVRVTVDSTGVPVDITLADSLEGWQPSRIAGEIMATMRRAQVELTGRIEQAAADTVGPGSETAQTVLASYHQRFLPDGEGSPRDGRPA